MVTGAISGEFALGEEELKAGKGSLIVCDRIAMAMSLTSIAPPGCCKPPTDSPPNEVNVSEHMQTT